MNEDYRSKSRVVFLVAVMMLSVFAMATVFAGSATADADFDNYEQPDSENFDYAVTSDGNAPGELGFSDEDSFETVGAAVQAADDAGDGPYSILVFSSTTETNIDQSGGDDTVTERSGNIDIDGDKGPAVVVDGDIVDKVASYNGPEDTTVTFDKSVQGETGAAVFDVNDGAEVRGLTIGGDWRQAGIVAGEDAT